MSSSLTENYQNALPYALLGASPSLAALHATRSRLLNPYQMDSLRSTHCSRCGTFGGEVRVYRSGRTRFLQRTCRACGFRDDVATDRGNAAVYTGRKKKGNRLVPDIRQTETTGETSDLSTPSILPFVSEKTSKTRPRKRFGLQNMLTRNREKEEQLKKSNDGGGLAAFLSGF